MIQTAMASRMLKMMMTTVFVRMKSLVLLLGLLLVSGPLVSAWWGDNDSDGDGIKDAEDDDDDNEGLLDVNDDDDDGDGILDGDEDDDGDGLENDEDPDDDGDGVLDENDELQIIKLLLFLLFVQL